MQNNKLKCAHLDKNDLVQNFFVQNCDLHFRRNKKPTPVEFDRSFKSESEYDQFMFCPFTDELSVNDTILSISFSVKKFFYQNGYRRKGPWTRKTFSTKILN